MLARAGSLIGAALSGGPLSRRDLQQVLTDQDSALDGSQFGHVLRDLTESMLITFAAPSGRQEVYALADHWFSEPRELPPARALAELVTRFVATRGAVTRSDIGRWTNLAMSDVDAGLAQAAVREVELGGTVYLMSAGSDLPTSSEVALALDDPLLLPPFDEYLISYGSRDALIAPEFLSRVIPGRNGMFKPIVVVAGEVVGIWSRKITSKKVTVTVEPFGKLTARQKRVLEQPASSYAAFLGLVPDLAFV